MADFSEFQYSTKATFDWDAFTSKYFLFNTTFTCSSSSSLTHFLNARQNNLMELWSLLHFLMPYIFRSRKEFSQWFSNPMNNIIEGNTNRNDDLISRLHGIIRPFVLRRLKKDVETQMPGKFEHIVKCNLSRRQVSAAQDVDLFIISFLLKFELLNFSS